MPTFLACINTQLVIIISTGFDENVVQFFAIGTLDCVNLQQNLSHLGFRHLFIVLVFALKQIQRMWQDSVTYSGIIIANDSGMSFKIVPISESAVTIHVLVILSFVYRLLPGKRYKTVTSSCINVPNRIVYDWYFWSLLRQCI